MTLAPAHRLLAAAIATATIALPAAGAVASDQPSGNVTLKVFKAGHVSRHTISYKLHGLKGHKVVSARLRTRKGSTKPVKLAPKKNQMPKAVVNDSGDG